MPPADLLSSIDKMERKLGLAAANYCSDQSVKDCVNFNCPFYDTCPLTAKAMWRTSKNLGSLGGLEYTADATPSDDSPSHWRQEENQKNI